MNCRYLIGIICVVLFPYPSCTTISSTCILLCTVDGYMACNSYISTLYRGVHLVCTNQAEKGLLRAVVHFPRIWFGPCTADQRATKRIPSVKRFNTSKYRLIGQVEYQHVIILLPAEKRGSDLGCFFWATALASFLFFSHHKVPFSPSQPTEEEDTSGPVIYLLPC